MILDQDSQLFFPIITLVNRNQQLINEQSLILKSVYNKTQLISKPIHTYFVLCTQTCHKSKRTIQRSISQASCKVIFKASTRRKDVNAINSQNKFQETCRLGCRCQRSCENGEHFKRCDITTKIYLQESLKPGIVFLSAKQIFDALPMGQAHVFNHEETKDSNAIYFGHNVCVARSTRGKGLGKELVKRSHKLAEKAGCSHTYILATGMFSQRIFSSLDYKLIFEVKIIYQTQKCHSPKKRHFFWLVSSLSFYETVLNLDIS